MGGGRGVGGMKQVEFAGIEDFPAGLLTSTLRCAADTLSNDTLGEREIDLDQQVSLCVRP